MSVNKVLLGDCLELMKEIPSGSVDMILCDLPYGTTACKWDVIIPFDKLWDQYERIIKTNGAIVLTALQPFTSYLILSNLNLFKYELIWCKNDSADFVNAKNRPMKAHENILVFSKGNIANGANNKMKYQPQGLIEIIKKRKVSKKPEVIGQRPNQDFKPYVQTNTNYPLSWLNINRPNEGLHPTQKPVSLFEYLIKTYTNENEIVLDNCAGSGTTAIACINTNRNYILMEKEQNYFDIINKRISEHKGIFE